MNRTTAAPCVLKITVRRGQMTGEVVTLPGGAVLARHTQPIQAGVAPEGGELLEHLHKDAEFLGCQATPRISVFICRSW
jgi:hypothetical protein